MSREGIFEWRVRCCGTGCVEDFDGIRDTGTSHNKKQHVILQESISKPLDGFGLGPVSLELVEEILIEPVVTLKFGWFGWFAVSCAPRGIVQVRTLQSKANDPEHLVFNKVFEFTSFTDAEVHIPKLAKDRNLLSTNTCSEGLTEGNDLGGISNLQISRVVKGLNMTLEFIYLMFHNSKGLNPSDLMVEYTEKWVGGTSMVRNVTVHPFDREANFDVWLGMPVVQFKEKATFIIDPGTQTCTILRIFVHLGLRSGLGLSTA
ncbi:hypothetical protein N7456_012346 [Penicillium angulare]|uniref:Uncharacterized protein n=1 Tax=Penicillium angulare TaxID=116970 RepID=A0A9W9EVQ6_9EURO|nr:hypothetical protein N7456_012346 [Penicillium angulare]